MQTRDYLNVGLKLLGAYFAVIGVTVLALTLINLAIQGVWPMFQDDGMVHAVEGRVVSVISAMQPVSYLACAFVLTRKTNWCLELIYPMAAEN